MRTARHEEFLTEPPVCRPPSRCRLAAISSVKSCRSCRERDFSSLPPVPERKFRIDRDRPKRSDVRQACARQNPRPAFAVPAVAGSSFPQRGEVPVPPSEDRDSDISGTGVERPSIAGKTGLERLCQDFVLTSPVPPADGADGPGHAPSGDCRRGKTRCLQTPAKPPGRILAMPQRSERRRADACRVSRLACRLNAGPPVAPQQSLVQCRRIARILPPVPEMPWCASLPVRAALP